MELVWVMLPGWPWAVSCALSPGHPNSSTDRGVWLCGPDNFLQQPQGSLKDRPCVHVKKNNCTSFLITHRPSGLSLTRSTASNTLD